MLMSEEHRPSMRALQGDADRGVDVSYYIGIIKRRILYFLIPFFVVFVGGFAIAMALKPVYVAEGRILVESQQIPTELVRPTITATAKERIQVIEQRIMTRENLLAIVDKFKMFGDQRRNMSGTQLLDLMRQRTRVVPFELDQVRRRSDSLTIALTIGFEDESPEIAMRVANELVTLILNEDARNRTSRAQETTNFLSREVKKLEADLSSIEVQISEFKVRNNNREPISEKASMQLVMLKAELQEKSAVYADAHPDMIRLKRQIAALEKITATSAQVENGLEALLAQRASIQKNLEGATQKFSTARVGESLERAQFSERLEVLEQAILPQKPFKPNRPKLLAAALAAALLAGMGMVIGMETLDSTIRGTRDLSTVVDANLLAAIPYISTKKEVHQRRVRAVFAMGTLATISLGGLVATHMLVRPLDELWTVFMNRLLG
jgi:uncharacterized protein involved in exopolysaccharide biosynthesis